MRTRSNPFMLLDRRLGISISVLLAAATLAVNCAADKPLPHAATVAARPLPLSAVRLTGGPLKHTQDLDADPRIRGSYARRGEFESPLRYFPSLRRF